MTCFENFSLTHSAGNLQYKEIITYPIIRQTGRYTICEKNIFKNCNGRSSAHAGKVLWLQ